MEIMRHFFSISISTPGDHASSNIQSDLIFNIFFKFRGVGMRVGKSAAEVMSCGMCLAASMFDPTFEARFFIHSLLQANSVVSSSLARAA